MKLFGKKQDSEQKKLSQKTKKIIKIISIVLVLAIAAGGVKLFLDRKAQKATAEINTAVAAIGTVRSAISASGTIEPINKYEVTALVKGDVLSDTFEEGDMVEKGATLYQIDTTEMQNTIERAKLSMEKTQNSYRSTLDNLEDLKIKAPIRGVITQLYVKVGDNVSAGGKICDMIDSSEMVLTVPFNSSDSNAIYVGGDAKVTLEHSFYATQGRVTRVASGALADANSVSITYVDIAVSNPGGIAKGDTATAIIGDVACNSPGTFDYSKEKTVTAKVGGEVKRLHYQKGDQLSENQVIVELESKNVDDSLTSGKISLREAQLSLENTYDQLDNYTITAPIGGTVIEKTIKSGDTIDNTKNNTVMCVIADLSTITFTINIDELDIEKIKLDQKVDITADALTGKTFEGRVNNININGTTANGVTTYPVKIVVNAPEGLLPGMNVNADIVIEEKANVLTVPVSSVMRGNMVYVKDNSTSSDKKDAPKTEGKRPQSAGSEGGQRPSFGQGNTPGRPASGQENAPGGQKDGTSQSPATGGNDAAGQAKGGQMSKFNDIPEGFRAVRVTTGINDENLIEIISGLSEGDIVYVKSATPTFNQMSGFGGGMPGMSGGGMPGGGMPSGGMPSRSTSGSGSTRTTSGGQTR